MRNRKKRQVMSIDGDRLSIAVTSIGMVNLYVNGEIKMPLTKADAEYFANELLDACGVPE